MTDNRLEKKKHNLKKSFQLHPMVSQGYVSMRAGIHILNPKSKLGTSFFRIQTQVIKTFV